MLGWCRIVQGFVGLWLVGFAKKNAVSRTALDAAVLRIGGGVAPRIRKVLFNARQSVQAGVN